ncbi:MAG: hypothetical protein ACRDZO_16400 [Egibacteraceae bacterium]
MIWCWFALCPQTPDGAVAAAPIHGMDGTALGVLAAWDPACDRPEGAAKIDARAIDPDGSEATASLVLAPNLVGVPFDDLAVSQAIRAVLALPPADVLSTLLVGDSWFVGAVTAVYGAKDRLEYDPFGLIFPARLVRVGAGLLGHMPPAAGPSMQRHGSSTPWPAGAFPQTPRATGAFPQTPRATGAFPSA